MIALGCDHGGYELMQEVIKYLEEHGLEYKNYGTYSTDSCDYPDYAKKVAEAILVVSRIIISLLSLFHGLLEEYDPVVLCFCCYFYGISLIYYNVRR